MKIKVIKQPLYYVSLIALNIMIILTMIVSPDAYATDPSYVLKISSTDSGGSSTSSNYSLKRSAIGEASNGTQLSATNYKLEPGYPLRSFSSGETTPPTVDAGSDVSKNAQFNLAGSASDADSGIASTVWSKVSGPGTVSFGDASSLTSTCSMNANGTYVLKLTATDNASNSNSDTVTVTWTGSDDPAPDDSAPDDSTPDDSTPDDSTPDDSTPDDSTPDDSTPEQNNPLIEAVDQANDAIDKAGSTAPDTSEKPTKVTEAVQKASDAVQLATEMIAQNTATPQQALITLDVVDDAFTLLGQSAKNGETNDIDTDNIVDTIEKVSNISKLAVETGQATDEEKKSIVTTTDNILKSMPDIIASVDKNDGLKIIAQVDEIIESGLKAGLSSAGTDTTKLTEFIDGVSDVITALALDTTITGNTNIVKSAVDIISKAVNTAKAANNQNNNSVVEQLQKETGSIIEAIHNNMLKNILPFSDLDQNKSFNQKSQARDLTKAEDFPDDTPNDTIDRSLITKEKIKALTQEVSNIIKPFIDNSTPIGQTLLKSILEVIDDAFDSVIDTLAISRGIDTSEVSLVGNESGLTSAISNYPGLLKDILEINSIDITKLMSESTLLSKIMMQQIAAGQLILSETTTAIKNTLPNVIDLDSTLLETDSVNSIDAFKNALLSSLQNTDLSLEIEEPGMIKGTLKWDGINTESHSIIITSVKIAPSSIANGIYLLPDGQIVTIYNNIAITAAPIFSDMFTLLDELVSLNIDFKILDDCRWTASLNDETIITGMIAYREYSLPLTKETPDYNILFELIGDEASSQDYSIAAVYNESMFQLLPPALYSLDQLVQLLDKLQLKYIIDRDNGVITIQDGLFYKPDYIINTLDSDDLQYWEGNKDELGIAWKEDDFNQDGIMDLEILTSEGKQILYQIKSKYIE